MYVYVRIKIWPPIFYTIYLGHHEIYYVIMQPDKTKRLREVTDIECHLLANIVLISKLSPESKWGRAASVT